MRCSTAASAQAKYVLVDINAFLHYFMGRYRHTLKKIIRLCRFIISA